MRRTGVSLLASAICAVVAASAWAADEKAPAVCPSPTEIHGFKTCADIAKAEQEGELVLYTTQPEHGALQFLAAFHDMFPKIKTNMIRLQAGALQAKIMTERQARTYLVDVLQQSDLGLVIDFQRRNGFAAYGSPQLAAYRPEFKSKPEGYWTAGAIFMAGIAYNPTIVPADQAPKTWEDLLDPKWKDAMSVKVSNAGLSHLHWWGLRQVIGPEYWQKMIPQKPRGFDSYVQQYDRLVNQQDKLNASAEYSGSVEFQRRGAPIAFVHPEKGLPAGPNNWGVVNEAPHPQAARLYYDWFLSQAGQSKLGEVFALHSARADVAPPKGTVPIDELKLIVPTDWDAFLASRGEFTREWDRMTGVR